MDTSPPTELYAGDSAEWQKVLSGYSVDDGWQATYYFKNAEQSNQLDGVGVATTFTFTALSSDTAGWAAGQYHWQLFAIDLANSKRKLIEEGDILVKPDPSAGGPQDFRTLNEQILDNINKKILGLEYIKSYAIGGRSLENWDAEDLLKWQQYYGKLVAQEQGKGTLYFVGASFEQP